MRHSTNLRTNVSDYLSRGGSLAGLASEIGISRTTLSLWYRDRYPHDPIAIESKLDAYFAPDRLSFKDEYILGKIEELLQRAEKRENIVAVIALRR
jgi:transposase-like protein